MHFSVSRFSRRTAVDQSRRTAAVASLIDASAAASPIGRCDPIQQRAHHRALGLEQMQLHGPRIANRIECEWSGPQRRVLRRRREKAGTATPAPRTQPPPAAHTSGDHTHTHSNSDDNEIDSASSKTKKFARVFFASRSSQNASQNKHNRSYCTQCSFMHLMCLALFLHRKVLELMF